MQISAGRPLGDACPANRDGDENDGLELLLLHQFARDQGPDVSPVAAGAQQRIGLSVSTAAEIIEHLAASDKLLANDIGRLRLGRESPLQLPGSDPA